MNTTDFLTISAAICPERDCLVFEGQRQSFLRTNERANRLANALAGLGIGKNDIVAILQVNCPQYIEAYFAIARLGAIMVPLNFRAKQEELVYMLGNAGAKALLVGSRYIETMRAMLPRLSAIQHIIAIDDGQPDMLCYEELICSGAADEVFTDIGDDDVTVLMYTAGTTGRPKGVPLRHSGFVSYVLQNVDPASPEIEERNLLTVPLYHVAGLQAMLAAVYGGRTLVLMKQFETTEWLKTVEQERVSRAMLVPTMLKWVIDHPDFCRCDLSSLRVLTYGAAPMPFEVIKKAIAVMPRVKFINAFGQTETASTITALGPEDHVIEGGPDVVEKKLKRLAMSIGRPLPDVEVRIVDESGQEVPQGETGEIVARGPRVMSGYWRDEQKTAQVIDAEGWLHTRDMGWVDDEGYIYLAGRKDDMIIRGGENISPEEVEDVVCAHPKIEEAAVVGVPDPEWGQQPVAFVILKKGETATTEEIIESCRARLSFKRPRDVVFVESLPRNPMGKVLKKQLREQYVQMSR
ncbi:MAG: long-chain-fatty-acid--CoA ligase [Chloroflexi bacterium]|nr:long-chain-fatty-acid--CoA ligase [Chloroflexota bacterium]